MNSCQSSHWRCKEGTGEHYTEDDEKAEAQWKQFHVAVEKSRLGGMESKRTGSRARWASVTEESRNPAASMAGLCGLDCCLFFLVNKVFFEMQPHSLAHVLSIAVFGLQWYVEWLQLRCYGPQAKMFTIQPFSKKVCHPLLHSRGSGQVGAGWGIAEFQLGLHFQQKWRSHSLRKVQMRAVSSPQAETSKDTVERMCRESVSARMSPGERKGHRRGHLQSVRMNDQGPAGDFRE